jgi:rubrerythrin
LDVSFGGRRAVIKRKLSDLTLVSFRLTQPDTVITDETEYQKCLQELMGLGSFFDALLVLRFIVFFLEDRRALVWGKTAQREILRALFVEPEMAAELSRLRYEMLSADSSFRNLRNVLNKRIRENRVEIQRLTSASGVRAELAMRESELRAVRAEEESLEGSVAREEAARLEARLRGAKAALDRDGAVRELERAKVHVLRSKFKNLEESGLYVLSRLLSQDECLVCDTRKPGLGKQVQERLDSGKCPVCGTPRATAPAEVVNLGAKRIQELQRRASLGEQEVLSSEQEIRKADETRTRDLARLTAVTTQRLNLSEAIRALRGRLPSTERSADDLDERNRELQRLIDEEESAYKRHRDVFEIALNRSEREVAKLHQEVAAAFSRYASVFLRERCSIAFQPVKVRIGQSGGEFQVGLFQLSMTGAAVGGETPRSEPDQVSMSQREFLDLAFRMALMSVASGDRAATLIVDTPDSSLDFLFAKRAGDQLARFAKEGGAVGNRVIVTTNLSNLDLIPAFLKGRPKGAQAASRVIDLLKIAAPNAALRKDRATYSRMLRTLLAKADAQK